MSLRMTLRIFVSPSRVLTDTSGLNLRMSLAWRGIRKKSWCPLPNLRKLSMRSHRNRPCIQDEIWPTQENFHWIELCKGIRNISKIYHTISRTEESEAPLVELHKYMARPLDVLFLVLRPPTYQSQFIRLWRTFRILLSIPDLILPWYQKRP